MSKNYLEPKLIKTWDFHKQIQPFLCDHMGIPYENFSSVHTLKECGGQYLNLWHRWVDLFADYIKNDSLAVHYIFELDEHGKVNAKSKHEFVENLNESLEKSVYTYTDVGLKYFDKFIAALVAFCEEIEEGNPCIEYCW